MYAIMDGKGSYYSYIDVYGPNEKVVVFVKGITFSFLFKDETSAYKKKSYLENSLGETKLKIVKFGGF